MKHCSAYLALAVFLLPSPSRAETCTRVSPVFGQENFLTLPFAVPDVVVTSGWEYDSGSCHRAIDYALPPAQPFQVRAADGGLVVAVRDDLVNPLGEFVVHAHDVIDDDCGRRLSLYAHLEPNTTTAPYRDLEAVRRDIENGDYSAWDRVSRGTPLATAGTTGKSTAIHLHYESHCGGLFLNKTDPYFIDSASIHYNPPACPPDLSKWLWTAECPPSLAPPPLEPVDYSQLILLYYLVQSTGEIRWVDPASSGLNGRLGFTGVTDPYGLLYDPASNRFYTADDQERLYALDPENAFVLDVDQMTFTWADGQPSLSVFHLVDMVLSPSGTVYALFNTTNAIYKSFLATVDLDSGDVVEVSRRGRRYDGFTYHPASDTYYASNRISPGSLSRFTVPGARGDGPLGTGSPGPGLTALAPDPSGDAAALLVALGKSFPSSSSRVRRFDLPTMSVGDSVVFISSTQTDGKGMTLGLPLSADTHSANLDFSDGFATTSNFTGFGANSVSVEAWVKTTGSPNQTALVVGLNDGGTDTFQIFFGKSAEPCSNQYCFRVNGQSSGSVDAGFVPQSLVEDGAWHHLAGTYDGTVVRFYLDGVQYGSDIAFSDNLESVSTPLSIGIRAIDSSVHWRGLVDEVRIWDRARSAQEISDNYLRELGGTEQGLTGYWRFEGDASDSSGASTALRTFGSPIFSSDSPFDN